MKSKNTPADLYSTFVVHSDDETLDDPEDDEDDESLPPLLKRIPKDFDATAIVFGDAYEHDAVSRDTISNTVIVKPDRNLSPPSPYSRKPMEFSDQEDEESNFSTFVVRSTVKKEREREKSVSGTMVRRSSGGVGDDDGSTMSRAVASMQASNLQEEEKKKLRKQTSKVSSSSIPDSVTREDPSTKYELLHELGIIPLLLILCILYCNLSYFDLF